MKILSKFSFFILVIGLSCPLMGAPKKPLFLKVEGVNRTIEKSIRAALNLENTKNHPFTEEALEALLSEAKEDIKHALEPFGYYAADVHIDIEKTKKTYRLIAKISLNEPVRVNQIHWQICGAGKNNPALKKLFEGFPLTPGMPFNHETYEQAKRDLLATAYFSGFIKAEFTVHEVHLHLEQHQADLYLTLNTERLYKMGEIQFKEDYFEHAYLNRFVPFETGDTFLPDNILTLQRNLTLSDQFSRVVIHQTPDETNPVVPIQIELERAKPNKYTFGAGYGTDTGIRGQAGWERRWINRYGHRFFAQGHLSQVYNQGYLEYQVPGTHPIHDNIALSLSMAEDEFSEIESQYWQFGISEKKKLALWERTLSLYYRAERFKEFLYTPKKYEKLLLPSIELSKLKKDSTSNPLDGYLIHLKLTGSINTLLSDASFAQLTAKINWLKSFPKKHSLLIKTQLGATIPNDISQLPLSMRFYAGGDNSLRGFGYRTLPKNRHNPDQKVSVGGAYLALATLEWSYMIHHPMGISAFIDAGNAFLDSHDPIEAGAGLGLRWHTPIGPLKIDLAKPLTSGAKSLRLHVTFGTGL